jgi:hypothetical protein
MNTSQILSIITARGEAEVAEQPRVLRLYPQGDLNGSTNGSELRFMAPSNMPLKDQLRVADRFLAAVQTWRDSIASEIQQTRTAESELAEARAEIARLKGEGGV